MLAGKALESWSRKALALALKSASSNTNSGVPNSRAKSVAEIPATVNWPSANFAFADQTESDITSAPAH